MHLVHDDHLAAQAQVPHGQMRGAHRPEEQVVHRGDDEVGEHRLLPSVEPGQDGQIGPALIRDADRAPSSGFLLIRADADWRGKVLDLAAEATKEPVMDLIAAAPQWPGFFVEPRATVQELDGEIRRRSVLGIGLLDILQPGQLAGEHGVRGRLGGQGEEHSGSAGPGGEHLGCHVGGLGLAAPCGLLDDEQARQVHGSGRC